MTDERLQRRLMPHWLKALLITAVVSTLVLIASIAILETVLRARFAAEVTRVARQDPPHPFLQVMASSLVAVNRHGFRGDSIEQHKAPRTFRIFTLGGSTTLGVGARYERLDLFNDSFKRADVELESGGKPSRATGSLEFNPSEFSRIRLQYTHDRSAPDGRDNNEVIAQFIFGIGAHAAHSF